ncbi:MAG: HAMP domain-containing histidine kinase [Lachnospiraceae bacterium]|nr:HAMP domain-containing histidine kinase [Lachnospiraceae bacterium]
MSERSGAGDTGYRKKPVNLAGGCIVGLLLAAILRSERIFVLAYLMPGEEGWRVILVRAIFDLCALAIFLCVLRYFLKMKSRKLTVYYLVAILISATAAVLSAMSVVMALKDWFLGRVDSGFWDTRGGTFLMVNIPYFFLVLLAAVFSGVFALLTRGRVKYIEYISGEVKIIENNGFGRKLMLSGEDEITDLCRSINHLSQKLLEKEQAGQEMERRKNELITNVSHDLRSPLASVVGYVQLLKKEGVSNPEKFEEYIDVVDRRLQGLACLVNELFELTKLNGSDVEMNFLYTDMVALLWHLACENEILLQQAGIGLVKDIVDARFEMEVDVGKMVRVIQNLFDNAGKYAKEASEVLFCVSCTDEVLEIRMQNLVEHPQGLCGDRLFERFYKGDTSRGEESGSGLGLAIVKRIVSLHGGKIEAIVKGELLCIRISFSKADKKT